MKDKIKIGGLITIGNMKFHDIEGGFGKDKKAMLVKEIAQIHKREIFKVNELINRNRKRFIDDVDIIDLKTHPFEGYVSELIGRGIFTKAEVGNANNIYILSERGYFKLLKILEDDLAWEKYGELLDKYFHMREVIKEIPKVETKAVPTKRSLGETNAAARIIMPTLKDANMPPQYRAVVLQGLYKSIGVEIPLDGIKTDKQLFNCTEIAEKLGIVSKAGKPHNQAVAAIIALLPISGDEKSLVPFQSAVNGHAGPTYQYTQSVVNKVSAWLTEHNYPAKVPCGGKSYKVDYKFKPGILKVKFRHNKTERGRGKIHDLRKN